MKTNIRPLQPDCFYHIYNRGVNGENLFKEEKNYAYFLKKYAQFVSPYISTYAYCLLKNHFHLLVRSHSEEETKEVFASSEAFLKKDDPHKEKDVSLILTDAFASFFKSYAQSINKAYQRSGRLFEEPFRRIHVNSDAYFTEMIYYIHHNPQKHGFVNDFRDYPHSSYQTHLLTAATKLQREEVISWFGSKTEYVKYHLREDVLQNLDKFDIEFD
jgi:putative transposase